MKNCNDYFRQHTGTAEYHRYGLFQNHFITDGVLDVAEKTKSFWFLDIITSYQNNQMKNEHPFQLWKLERVDGNKFKVVCMDGNYNHILDQDISFSDFQYDEYTIWLRDNIIYLPSEN